MLVSLNPISKQLACERMEKDNTVAKEGLEVKKGLHLYFIRRW